MSRIFLIYQKQFRHKNYQLIFHKVCFTLFFAIPVVAKAQFKTYNSGQVFTCITVDSNYNVWAGTSKTGLYLLNKKSSAAATQFTIASTGTLSTAVIQTLAADQFSNVWVGHSGAGSSTANGGGIEQININNPSVVKHYSPDRNAECYNFLARDGIATLNSFSLAVDKYGTVWSAHKYHDLFVEGTPPDIILGIPTGGSPAHYIVTPGGLSYKFGNAASFVSRGTYEDYRAGTDGDLPYPAYTCDASISQTPGSRNTYAIGVGNTEAWLSVASYVAKNGTLYPARLLRYRSDGTYNGSFDFASIGIPGSGIFNGICVTQKGDVWVTANGSRGFAVRKKGNWLYMNIANLSCIFPAGAIINNNAIWCNKLGQVFIGTSKGLVVYNGTGPVQSVSSYTLYTTANNSLLSDQILAGASEKDTIQWMVTDKGIMSSTLGRNYPASTNDVDYTSCSNSDINLIEDQTKTDVTSRKDYHYYRIETVVCTQSGPNGSNCNGEYVYKMMKSTVKYTTPTVADFPHDNLATGLLTGVTKTELSTIIANVNAWQTNTSSGNENGGVKNIRQVLPQNLINLYYGTIGKGKIPFIDGIFLASNDVYEARQAAANPVDAISCSQIYKLYNSPNYIVDRAIFNNTLAYLPFGCDHLTSNEYDEVRIFADDKNLTFTNYTERGHFLFPGKVFRSVIEECGQVKIVTVGTGLSSCGSGIRGLMNGNGNVITGSILFKNIDLRLKAAFEKIH